MKYTKDRVMTRNLKKGKMLQSGEYLMMIGKKTAKKCLKYPQSLSLLSEMPAETSQKILKGMQIISEIAFQILDDRFDINSTEAELGKRIEILWISKTYLLL